ncbi:hypothetical protein YC2023_009866 [Brassica napus]
MQSISENRPNRHCLWKVSNQFNLVRPRVIYGSHEIISTIPKTSQKSLAAPASRGSGGSSFTPTFHIWQHQLSPFGSTSTIINGAREVRSYSSSYDELRRLFSLLRKRGRKKAGCFARGLKTFGNDVSREADRREKERALPSARLTRMPKI